MSDIQNIIIDTLENIGSNFKEDELAYLALTTKAEFPVRDRWAFSLHKKLDDSYQVSREWFKTDLAILHNNQPKALIELKAMYTFNALSEKERKNYIGYMASDERKAEKLAKENTEIYTVLLATHPQQNPSFDRKGVIKYQNRINRSFKKLNSGKAIEEVAKIKLNAEMPIDKKRVWSGEIVAGTAFGVDVSVFWWVIKAER